MTTLFLIRHALAAAPGDLRLPGPDLPLLPRGIAQARQLAHRMCHVGLAAVYASDARRALQTGEIIAAACGVPILPLPELREIDLGAWGGLTYADVAAADPQAAHWFTDPATGTPPEGESGQEAAERVLAVIRRIANGPHPPPRGYPAPSPMTMEGERTRDSGPFAIVGHAGSLRLALARALEMPLASYWRLRLDCASISRVEWSTEGPIVMGLNDTAHLTGNPHPLSREVAS